MVSHLEQLIEWEIRRAWTGDSERGPGLSTRGLDSNGWKWTRDGLADLWSWWGGGAHLRPQPERGKRQQLTYTPPYVVDLVEWAAPQMVSRGDALPRPARISTLDAHLGDGLFRLYALVHFHIAEQDGWIEHGADENNRLVPSLFWNGVSGVTRGPRPCQSIVPGIREPWVLFAPSGHDPRYFVMYSARIRAAGWRSGGVFPFGIDVRGADLRDVTIDSPPPREEPRPTNWDYANISGACVSGSCFYQHHMAGILADAFVGWLSLFLHATLSNANLKGANLREAHLEGAALEGANLEGVYPTGTRLEGTSLRRTMRWGRLPAEAIRQKDASKDVLRIDSDDKAAPKTKKHSRGSAPEGGPADNQVLEQILLTKKPQEVQTIVQNDGAAKDQNPESDLEDALELIDTAEEEADGCNETGGRT